MPTLLLEELGKAAAATTAAAAAAAAGAVGLAEVADDEAAAPACPDQVQTKKSAPPD